MKIKAPLKIMDIAVILAALGLTVFSAFASYVKPEGQGRVMIRGAAGQWIFPLDAEETVNVEGPLGTTVIRISENNAWVESSPCGGQTCVAAGRVHSPGAWTACLPNKVFFMVEGNNESKNGPDAGAW